MAGPTLGWTERLATSRTNWPDKSIKERTMNGRECEEEDNKHTYERFLETGRVMLIYILNDSTYLNQNIFWSAHCLLRWLGCLHFGLYKECNWSWTQTPLHNARITCLCICVCIWCWLNTDTSCIWGSKLWKYWFHGFQGSALFREHTLKENWCVQDCNIMWPGVRNLIGWRSCD